MVYLDSEQLGWENILETWAYFFREREKDKEKDHVPPYINLLIEKVRNFFRDNFPFLRNKCKEMIPSADINMVSSCLNLINVMFQEFKEKVAHIDKLSNFDIENYINMIFIFSFIWSAGANMHDNPRDNSRINFSQHIKTKILKIFSGFPFEGEVYDYFIDFTKKEFKPWKDKVPSWSYNKDVPYFNILVPTADTVKLKFMLEKLIKGG